MKVKIKLILIWLLSIIMMLILVAGVSSYLSWSLHKNEAKEQIGRAFELLDNTIHKDIDNMKVNAKALSERSEVVAGISLITNYQDTQNYQPLIFDVEKKKLLSILSTQGYASGIDMIALYDGNSQLSSFFVVDDDELIHPEGYSNIKLQKPDQTHHVGYISYDQGVAKFLIAHTVHDPFLESTQLPDLFSSTLPEEGAKAALTRIYDSSDGLVVEVLQPVWRSLRGGKKKVVGLLRLARVMDRPYVGEMSTAASMGLTIWFSESRQFGDVEAHDDLPQIVASSKLVKMESDDVHQHSWIEHSGYFMGISRQQLVDGKSVAFIFNVSKEQLQMDAEQARNAALIVLLFGFAVVPLGIFLLNRNISTPISKLTSSVVSLQEGSFNRIDGLGEKNEFGILASSFNNMANSIQMREKALQQSEERFSLAMRGANDGLWDWNLKTDEVYYSPRWKSMLGYEEEELEAKLDAWAALVHSDDKDWVLEKVQDYLEGRTDSFEVEMRMRHKDGHEVIVLSRAFLASREPDGKPVRLVGTHVDITERKQLEEQLLQSQKMEAIGTLVGGIAHDFNNTLAAIQGNLYLAKAKMDDAAVLNTKLNNIEKLSGRAAEMVQQLLTFARKDMVSTRPFSLTSFMKEEYKISRSIIPENIDYSMNLCGEELIIQGDATQLQQVLINLQNNARDAVRNSSRPKIVCTLDSFTVDADFQQRHPAIKGNRVAHLTVEDNGCGISEKILAQIFVPFFTTKGVGEGTGLGLAMVYGSIQTHGGVIEVDSREGEGTAVHIYLPLREGDEKIFEEPKGLIIPGEGETILLVDDETDMREATEEVLSSLGYRVLSAEDGVEAVKLFKTNADDVSLVITDLVMPRMGGVDAAKQMRLLNSEVPIIFATGYDKDQSASSSEEIKRSTTISKPFSFEALSQLMRRMIAPN